MGRSANLTLHITDVALPATFGKSDLFVAFGIATALTFGSNGYTVRTLDALDIILGLLLHSAERYAAGTA